MLLNRVDLAQQLYISFATGILARQIYVSCLDSFVSIRNIMCNWIPFIDNTVFCSQFFKLFMSN